VIRQNSVLSVDFHNRQLRGAEHRYSATGLDTLAFCQAIKHYSYFLHRIYANRPQTSDFPVNIQECEFSSTVYGASADATQCDHCLQERSG